MKIQVIIPAYRNLREILTCLVSLRDHSRGVSIHIQDDDPGSDWARLFPSDVATYAVNELNVGFGANCNAGADFVLEKLARPDILFFVNQDIYLPRDTAQVYRWDERLAAPFENPEIGVVGCRLLDPTGAIQHAGIIFDGACQPHHRYLGFKDAEFAPAATGGFVPAVTGAALAIRTEVWEQLFGFDAAVYPGGYFEDVDLCIRAQREGHKIWYEPSVRFYHKTGTSGGNPNFMRNAFRFRTRWVDTGAITADIPAIKENFWA